MKRLSGIWALLWMGVFSSNVPAAEHASAVSYSVRPEPAVTSIVLAIDCSGSMKGGPMKAAKNAAVSFIGGMRSGDLVSVVSFASSVEEILPFSSSRSSAREAVQRLRAGGSTRLNDAIAKSMINLEKSDGAKVIVYLTDGRDTGSRFRLDELEDIGISDGIFVYGIGLGDVDTAALSDLSRATGGEFRVASSPSDLHGIYTGVLGGYYRKYGNNLATKGKLTVRSIPGRMKVLVDDRSVGFSPVKLDNLPEGTNGVKVIFPNGVWDNEVPVKAGNRTGVEARASDLGCELTVMSLPGSCQLFMDGTYCGSTSCFPPPVKPGDKSWEKSAREDARQLVIHRVPYGTRKLRLKALPEFEFGSEQDFEMELDISHPQAVVFVKVFGTPSAPGAECSGCNAKIVKGRGDVFKELENETSDEEW